jgi:hypothetical protein
MSWRSILPQPERTNRLNPDKEQLRQLDRDNLRYPFDRLVEQPRDKWPVEAVSHKHIRVLRSRDFLVQVLQEADGVLRLSIQRTAFDKASGRWKDGIGWDDIQHLKTLAGYGDRPAVELYPPDANVVNVANIRHIWILPEAPSWMWGSKA